MGLRQVVMGSRDALDSRQRGSSDQLSCAPERHLSSHLTLLSAVESEIEPCVLPGQATELARLDTAQPCEPPPRQQATEMRKIVAFHRLPCNATYISRISAM